MPLVAHLVELRDRLLRVLAFILLIFVALISFANDIYTIVAQPLMAHLPANGSMIATDVASPFLTPFKLTMVLSVFISMPFVLYQIWAFVAPGLYRHERRLMVPLLASSTVLFYLGAVFAYFVVFPVVFGFFASAAPTGVTVMTDISKYLDFVLKMFFAFGLAFEVPIATIVICWAGITTPQALAEKRPYIIVAAFVIGMLLTPPDVISQTLLAVPMLILFEAGLFFARIFLREREKAIAEEEESEHGEESEEHFEGSTVVGPAAASEQYQDEMDIEFARAEEDERRLNETAGEPPHEKDR